MNKKAGQRVLIFYWVIIMIIVLIGIVSGVLHVFSGNIDIRRAEAGLLRDRIVSCLIDKGKFKTEIYESEDLLNKCKIKISEEHAVQLEIDGQKKIFGNENLLETCENSEKNFPRCIKTTIYVLKQNEQAYLKITTAVDKNEKNL